MVRWKSKLEKCITRVNDYQARNALQADDLTGIDEYAYKRPETDTCEQSSLLVYFAIRSTRSHRARVNLERPAS